MENKQQSNLAYELALNYSAELRKAKRAIMRSTELPPPSPRRAQLETYAARFLKDRGEADIIDDEQAFSNLIEEAFEFATEFQEFTEQGKTRLLESKFARGLMGDPQDSRSRKGTNISRTEESQSNSTNGKEDDQVRELEAALRSPYHTWVSYAGKYGDGKVGSDIPRKKSDLKSWMIEEAKRMQVDVPSDMSA